MTFSVRYSVQFRLVVLAGMVPAFSVAGSAATTPAHVAGSHLATPSGLRCDRETEPLAIADERPELSWGDKAARLH